MSDLVLCRVSVDDRTVETCVADAGDRTLDDMVTMHVLFARATGRSLRVVIDDLNADVGA